MMAGVCVITVVPIRQVVIQIFPRRVLVLTALLDFRLLAGRRAEVAMLKVLALLVPVVLNIALLLPNGVRVVVHVLIILRMRKRKNQQRAECACNQSKYKFRHEIDSLILAIFTRARARSLVAFPDYDAGPMPEKTRAYGMDFIKRKKCDG
jgi:predicted membrane protein